MPHGQYGYQSGPSMAGIGGRLPGGGGAPPGYGGFSGFGPPAPSAPGSSIGGALKGIGRRIAGGAGDAVRWGSENPEIAAAILGTGVEVWGARKAGQQADAEYEENIRRYEREQEREDERQRNRAAAYQRILDRRSSY